MHDKIGIFGVTAGIGAKNSQYSCSLWKIKRCLGIDSLRYKRKDDTKKIKGDTTCLGCAEILKNELLPTSPPFRVADEVFRDESLSKRGKAQYKILWGKKEKKYVPSEKQNKDQ